MRALALLSLLMVAGCGGGGETPANNATAAASPPPATLPAGQWELVSEVTGFTVPGGGAPKINTPVGTRANVSVCVGSGAQAPAQLFTEAGYDCSIGNYYASNGRISVSLLCRRSGLEGTIPTVIDGTFTADGLDYTRNVRTVLTTDGDVVIDSHVTGRRTGECTSAAGGGGGNSH